MQSLSELNAYRWVDVPLAKAQAVNTTFTASLTAYLCEPTLPDQPHSFLPFIHSIDNSPTPPMPSAFRPNLLSFGLLISLLLSTSRGAQKTHFDYFLLLYDTFTFNSTPLILNHVLF
jgi:hypothetical protein